jgi:hypothetical protein
MTGKISEDPDKVIDGTEKLAAAAGGQNYGPLVSSIATYLASLTQTLTSKGINGASNTVTNLTTAMFAANVIDTDTALAANSDTRIATQKAVKAYADALIATNDAMVFKGAIDCSANPNYPAANRGDTYRASVAGKIGGASGTTVEAGDIFICNTDGTAAGTQAAVGASWNVIQTNIDGAVTGPSSSTSGNLPKFNGTSGKVLQDSGVAISTDGTMASNSDFKVPTEKAVRTYVREKLTAARTYYFRTDGSDSNTGLVNSVGGAFLTAQKAYDTITSGLDLGGQTVTILAGVASQTFSAGLAITQPWTGGGSIVLDGASGTISATSTCINNTCVLPGTLTVQNLTLASSGGAGILMQAPGNIIVGSGVTFGATSAASYHMGALVAGALIKCTSQSYGITGGAQIHIGGVAGGQVQTAADTVTITGKVTCSYFAYADRVGFINANANTYKGSIAFTVTIASPAVVTSNSHGLSVNDPWTPNTTGALPTGLTAGTTYFVIAAGFGANSFQVSTTVGGSAVNTSGSQSGTHNWYSLAATKYNATGNGVVFTNSGGANYVPGNVAGVTGTGGQYI